MRLIIIILALSFVLFSCGNNDKQRPSTALDTGREFIRASLDGDFPQAETLLLKDSQNIQLFQSYKQFYMKLPETNKKNYKSSSYNINKFSELNDSVTIINYSNSYMNKPMNIKVVRNNSEWNIDFKYTYSDD